MDVGLSRMYLKSPICYNDNKIKILFPHSVLDIFLTIHFVRTSVFDETSVHYVEGGTFFICYN